MPLRNTAYCRTSEYDKGRKLDLMHRTWDLLGDFLLDIGRENQECRIFPMGGNKTVDHSEKFNNERR